MRTIFALLLFVAPALAQFGNATRIHGIPVDTVAPSQGQLLCYDASARMITWGSTSTCTASHAMRMLPLKRREKLYAKAKDLTDWQDIQAFIASKFQALDEPQKDTTK